MTRATTDDIEIGRRKTGAERGQIVCDHDIRLEALERARGRAQQSFARAPVGGRGDEFGPIDFAQTSETAVLFGRWAKQHDLARKEPFPFRPAVEVLRPRGLPAATARLPAEFEYPRLLAHRLAILFQAARALR